MPNGLLGVQHEKRVREPGIQAALVPQPVLQPATTAVTGDYVKFGTVAGRQQHDFMDAIYVSQALTGPAHLVSRENDLFANFNRCRVMVQPEYLQPHSAQLYAN
jgi:hypothetical protein